MSQHCLQQHWRNLRVPIPTSCNKRLLAPNTIGNRGSAWSGFQQCPPTKEQGACPPESQARIASITNLLHTVAEPGSLHGEVGCLLSAQTEALQQVTCLPERLFRCLIFTSGVHGVHGHLIAGCGFHKLPKHNLECATSSHRMWGNVMFNPILGRKILCHDTCTNSPCIAYVISSNMIGCNDELQAVASGSVLYRQQCGPHKLVNQAMT